MTDHPKINESASQVRGVVLDVDGVLTDGRIIYADNGSEAKQFHVRDGASIKLLAANGIPAAIITGRRSEVVSRRAKELGISHVIQGAANKPDALSQLIIEGFPDEGLCAIGDDIQDLALFDHPAVCLTATVADAHPAVRQAADMITLGAGGSGVVVELAEVLLRAQGKWPFVES